MFPPKLRPGDGLRLVAPSCTLPSMAWATDAIIRQATARLKNLGLNVSWGKHVREIDELESTSVDARLEDLHDAFSDATVQCIMAIRGGWNANQLLNGIDYDLIKKNPKVLCGFSDITALTNAIHSKTGLVTYSGPNFSTICKEELLQYTLDSFEKCLFQSESFVIEPSPKWNEGFWPLNNSAENDGLWALHEGTTEGTLIGGNLCTLNLLQGTPYFPSLKNSILFLEEDSESLPRVVDRDLQSLIHQPSFKEVRGIVFGRFQKASGMTNELLEKIIATKRELKHLPIVANADFGHTLPMITFPIGGRVRMRAEKNTCSIEILEH